MNHLNKTTRSLSSSLLLLVFLLLMTGCIMPITPDDADAPNGTVPEATVESSATPAATAAATEIATETDLAGTSWQLVAFGPPNASLPVIPESIVTIEFGTNGEVGGSGGCNSYGGQYQTEGNTLTVSEIVSTLRACLDDGVTEQEMGYLAALQLADSFEISEDMLTIAYGEGSGVLTFMAAVATP